MRPLSLAVLLLLAALGVARAEEPPLRAGVTRLTVQDAVPFDTLIAYPTVAAERPFPSGAFTVTAARDAPIATGRRFPVVLFSRGGGGASEAGPLFHLGLVTFLARRGFIVVAPFHPATGQPLVDRPRQIRAALDGMLADPRFAAAADPARLGMIGFSYGGAVTLIAAGAVPSLAHLAAYCAGRSDDPLGCQGAPAPGAPVRVYARSADVLPLKAIVLLEPFGALFDRAGLQAVQVPALLYGAETSELGRDGNVVALAESLPQRPLMKETAGGHFMFLDPCPAAIEAAAPEVCRDPPGADRAAFHKRLEADVADFLERTL